MNHYWVYNFIIYFVTAIISHIIIPLFTFLLKIKINGMKCIAGNHSNGFDILLAIMGN